MNVFQRLKILTYCRERKCSVTISTANIFPRDTVQVRCTYTTERIFLLVKAVPLHREEVLGFSRFLQTV